MRISKDFMKVTAGGETALVSAGSSYKNGIFVLNETAERIFDLLDDGKERDEIADILCSEYDTDRQTAEEYTDEYIAKLRETGILLDD